jgi:hypothetical protein
MQDSEAPAMKFKSACFSGQYPAHSEDSEFVYAAGTNNVLYVFEATSGQLKTQLNRIHTPAEALRCHPFSPVLLSHHPIPQSVLVWTVLHQGKWSQYEPHFTDIQCSSEYIQEEKEDDLDLHFPKEDLDSSDEAESIDVVSINARLLPCFKAMCHPGFQTQHTDVESMSGMAAPSMDDVADVPEEKPNGKELDRGRNKKKRKVGAKPVKKPMNCNEEDTPSFSEESDEDDSDFAAPPRLRRHKQDVEPKPSTSRAAAANQRQSRVRVDEDSSAGSDDDYNSESGSAHGVDLEQLADVI